MENGPDTLLALLRLVGCWKIWGGGVGVWGELRKRKKDAKERRDPGFQVRTEGLELSPLLFL